MTIVALIGDVTTTTAVALAVGWPNDTMADARDGVIVVEADPSGGSLAAWLDTPVQPTLASVVAAAGSSDDPQAVLATVEALAHHSRTGVRFVANEVRSRAAHRAVEEAPNAVLPALAASVTPMIVDIGRPQVGALVSPATLLAEVVVLVHRQDASSPAAASVRIERLAETAENLSRTDATIVLAVVGTTPFEPSEVAEFVATAVPDSLAASVVLAEDSLAAFTIAGRTGVSAKRLHRLPLMRDAADAATTIHTLLDAPR